MNEAMSFILQAVQAGKKVTLSSENDVIVVTVYLPDGSVDKVYKDKVINGHVLRGSVFLEISKDVERGSNEW